MLHTAAYWLMLAVRDAIPKPRDLASAEFATLRLRLIKIAARVIETASRVRLAFAAACPEADLFRSLPTALLPSARERRGIAPFASRISPARLQSHDPNDGEKEPNAPGRPTTGRDTLDNCARSR